MHRLPRFRAPFAVVAWLAYALPTAVGALAALGHGAYHASERIAERRARAAAFGLAHVHEAAAAARESRRASGPGGSFTRSAHEHGGRSHAHAEPVDALLRAANEEEREPSPAAPTVIELAGHLPASAPLFSLERTPTHLVSARSALPAEAAELPPPLPPPRG